MTVWVSSVRDKHSPFRPMRRGIQLTHSIVFENGRQEVTKGLSQSIVYTSESGS